MQRIPLIGLVYVALLANPAAGQVVLPYGTFQEIFVTDDMTAATSTDISAYNSFVTAEAALNPALPSVTWSAVASTASIAANINAPSGSYPVYNTAGQLVSVGNTIYSGSLTNPVGYDQFGNQIFSTQWTGTNANGTAAMGNTLGTATATIGYSEGSATALSYTTSSTGGGVTNHLYALSSPITNIASVAAVSSSSPIPGGTGNFTSFSTPTLDSGGTAFFGAGTGGQQGIYITTPPSPIQPPIPIKMADLNTAIPGGTGNFTSFTLPGSPLHPPEPLISGQNVAFFGAGSGGQQGIYGVFPPVPLVPPSPIAPPAPIKLADLNTAIPGGVGNFTGFVPPVPLTPPNPWISGQNVAFFGAGSGGQEGIYASYVTDALHPPAPVKIADLNTAIPGGTGNFTSVPPQPMISGLNVAFVGNGSGGQQGIYGAFPPSPIAPPNPVKIADTTTAIPGGTGMFTSFMAVSTTATDTAFLAAGSGGQSGIYDRTAAGALLDVVSVGQLLNGKTITSLAFNNAGLSGDPTIAFQATFSDGSSGNFTLPVPERTGALLLVLGAIIIATAQRSKRG